jgi:hypothetical protein
MLVSLLVSLFLSDRWFPFIDDECAIVEGAARPALHTVSLFLRGVGQHEHPPLFDLILYGWLRVTHGWFFLIRLPSEVFYVLGLWMLSRTARKLGNSGAATCLVWLGVLWPYGFHYGRLAGWYSFGWLVLSMVTKLYVDLLSDPSRWRVLGFIAASVALIYTSYFGWLLLGCLAFDFVMTDGRDLKRVWRPVAFVAAGLGVAYLPIWLAFFHEIHLRAKPPTSPTVLLLSGAYNLYSLCVSESVAPWVWGLSLPVAVAIAVSAATLTRFGPATAVRFAAYFLFCLTTMNVLSIATVKRIMLIAPWLLLSLAVALSSLPRRLPRALLVGALTFIASVGWVGIVSRRFYAAPRWLEPWKEVAQTAALTLRDGGTVIGNSGTFFFYLKWVYHIRDEHAQVPVAGLVPDSTPSPNLYMTGEWMVANHPTKATVLFVKGLQFGYPAAPTRDSYLWLADHCQLADARRIVHDPGSSLKQRYFPQLDQDPWRIQILRFACPK